MTQMCEPHDDHDPHCVACCLTDNGGRCDCVCHTDGSD